MRLKVLFLAVGILFGTSLNAAPSLWTEPTQITGDPGETVQIRVFVSAPQDQITAFQFTISFDTNAVSFVGAQIGSDLDERNFNISNVNEDYTTEPPECGNRSVLVQLWGGASNWFMDSNLEAVVLTFTLADGLCRQTPVCFTSACASTQMVTYQLQTLCSPPVGLTGGSMETICVSDAPPVSHGRTALGPNVPNPFNPSTTFEFSLAEAQPGRLVIHTVDGRAIRTLRTGFISAGVHEEIWDGRDDHGNEVPAGIYYYKLVTAAESLSRKMVLLK